MKEVKENNNMTKHNQTLINISLITLTLFIVGMVVWGVQKSEPINPSVTDNRDNIAQSNGSENKENNKKKYKDSNCLKSDLRKISENIDKDILNKNNLEKSEGLNRLIECYQLRNRASLADIYAGRSQESVSEINLLDIDNDKQNEIVLVRQFNTSKNNLKEISVLQKRSGIYVLIGFKYIPNSKKDEHISYSEVVRLDDAGFNDYDGDGVFESFNALENFYIFRDGTYVRVNETRNRDIDCVNNKFPKCVWLDSPHATSSNEEMVVWLVPDIYSDGGGSLLVTMYNYQSKEFSGYDAKYGSPMEYLEMTLDNSGVIFLTKNCDIPGCQYYIKKLMIYGGDVVELSSIFDSSFDENDNITDEEVVKLAKEFAKK